MDFYTNYYQVGSRIKSRAAQNEYYGAIVRYYFEGEEPSFKYESAAVGFQGVFPSLQKQRTGRINRLGGIEGSNSEANEKQTESKSEGKVQGNAQQPGKKSESNAEEATSNKQEATSIVNTPIVPIDEIVSFLNEKTGKNFRSSNAETRKLINGRWADGYRLDDFKQVIETKCTTWGKDPKMSAYLRPSTLFRPGNFESYLNENSQIRSDKYAKYNR